MPEHEPLTVLLINDLGEEVKLVTLSFRGFFPGCRVEVAYSLDEALQWTPRADWHLILLEERLTASRDVPIVSELKRLAPYATLVLQTERSDSTAAIDALRAGADFLLYKKSPAFLTELMLYTKGAAETRRLRIGLERMQERYGRLADTVADVLYELDAEGRFVYLSPSITALLGYAPEELTGAPYSTVIPPDQLAGVRHRFDDRRTGGRAARRIEIELTPKTTQGGRPPRIPAELSAKGLYDLHRRYLGTVGILRDISRRREREQQIRRLERQLQEHERLAQAAQRLSSLSMLLQGPLNAVLSQSRQLLNAMQEAKLDDQVESLLRQATEAVRRGEELARTARDTGAGEQTLHAILDGVLASTTPPLLETDRIERQYGGDLPPFTGDAELAARLFRTLLTHALRYFAAVGSRHRLRISTAAVGQDGAVLGQQPALVPPVQAAEFRVSIEETDLPAAGEAPPLEESGDLFEIYRWVRQLGGRLDFQAPVSGRLSMTLWLPVERGPDRTGEAGEPALPTPAIDTPSVRSDFAQTAPPSEAATPPKPAGPLPDRRRTARVSVHLPATITIGSVTYEGTVNWLGPGGAGLHVVHALPPLDVDEQPAYVILKTAAGLLAQGARRPALHRIRRSGAEGVGLPDRRGPGADPAFDRGSAPVAARRPTDPSRTDRG
jgi:PAS domain S-box-containing protein